MAWPLEDSKLILEWTSAPFSLPLEGNVTALQLQNFFEFKTL